MSGALRTDVWVQRDETAVLLEAGTSVPKWAKELVTNPKAFGADSESEDAGDGESDEGEQPEGYGHLKGDELRDLLKGRELPTTGTNAELVERLEADDLESEDAGDGESGEENQE